MIPVEATSALALAAALLLLLPLLAARRRRGATQRNTRAPDTTTPRFTPQAVRVLSVGERQAHTLLRQSMPGYLVLARVPLTRFLRVDSRHAQWVQLVNGMTADLLLCDSGSRVLVVVELRPEQPSASSRKRHERMARLLKAAGIKVVSWPEQALPDVAAVRAQLVPLLTGHTSRRPAEPSSRPMPLIPVAEILAEGDADADAGDPSMEPVPSALFDEFEPDLPHPVKR